MYIKSESYCLLYVLTKKFFVLHFFSILSNTLFYFPGEVMLHVACRKGNIEKVKSLLNNPHIRVNAQDYAGWTPLQEAIVKNRIECIKVLLSYNPPIGEHVDTSLANFIEGTTPLMTAARYNNLLACEMLLKHSGMKTLKLFWYVNK